MYSDLFPYLVTGAIAIALGDFAARFLVWPVCDVRNR
jgi:hypothetical protein